MRTEERRLRAERQRDLRDEELELEQGFEEGEDSGDDESVGAFQALLADGIPTTSFTTDDVEAEHARLAAAGVVFTQPPAAMGPVVTAVFDDTCGNLVQLVSASLTPSSGGTA